ncbi:iron chelate uptake ABC transporter family permease subunit [Ensifer sp. 4252]|uniref:iron chelate uptake ABC transporter family permease subunit n=1 Tax=Ensifer sp. 4252 TaxID=3373915 RepID=UPI003D19772A
MSTGVPLSPPATTRCRLPARSRDRTKFLALLAGAVLLIVAMATSLLLGARPVAADVALQALFGFDPTSVEHVIIRDYRLPRTLLGLLAGSAFGVSGALIQAATRNPLADPGILGVNAGAAFFVIVAVGILGLRTIDAYLGFAMLGAVVATAVVYAVGANGREGATPMRLVLAGVALSAVLSGIGSSITLLDPQAFEQMRHWSIGSIAGRDMHIVAVVAPMIGAGLLLALALARPLNAVALGDELASTLGAGLGRTRIGVAIAVTLLAGGATAAAGPVGFIGLMVPHAVRWFSGPDQRWIVALTALFSPSLILAADIAGRLLIAPDELEAGILTALIGAPVLILLARRRKATGL